MLTGIDILLFIFLETHPLTFLLIWENKKSLPLFDPKSPSFNNNGGSDMVNSLNSFVDLADLIKFKSFCFINDIPVECFS